MGEAKKRKALDDMNGMGNLPESARSFIRSMQDVVRFQARIASTGNNVRGDHQLFLDGMLNGESGIFSLSIPAVLFNFGEYAFSASIQALTGFMGVTRFGIAMHATGVKSNAAPGLGTEKSNVIMMLACIDGTWFYNMIKAGEKEAGSMSAAGDWQQAEIKDLAISDQSKRFMTAIEETLKKSRSIQNDVKAAMTLDYLKEHYRATIATPGNILTGGDVSIN